MQYALLWSKAQNCLHIETVVDLAHKNAKALAANQTLNDYHPIFIGSREDCDRLAERCRETLIKRDMNRDD
jgi:precorrin-6B methylase 2